MQTKSSCQTHVRIELEMKKAIKIYCARSGLTEQAWLYSVISKELKRVAPDLWQQAASAEGR